MSDNHSFDTCSLRNPVQGHNIVELSSNHGMARHAKIFHGMAYTTMSLRNDANNGVNTFSLGESLQRQSLQRLNDGEDASLSDHEISSLKELQTFSAAVAVTKSWASRKQSRNHRQCTNNGLCGRCFCSSRFETRDLVFVDGIMRLDRLDVFGVDNVNAKFVLKT